MGVTFLTGDGTHDHAGDTLGGSTGVVGLVLLERADDPGAPSATAHVLYVKDDGKAIVLDWRTSGSVNIVDTAGA